MKRKRKIELLVGIVVGILFALLLTLEWRLISYTPSLKKPGSTVIFGLLNINILLLILSLFFVVRNIIALFIERKRGVVGSKLKTKLITSFVLISIIPTLLLFFFSLLIFFSSMERWFNYKIENSLENACKVEKRILEIEQKELIKKASLAKELIQKIGIKGAKEFISIYKPKEFGILGRDGSCIYTYSSFGKYVHKPKKKEIKKAILRGHIIRFYKVKHGEMHRIYFYIPKNGMICYLGYYFPYRIHKTLLQVSAALKDYRNIKMLRKPFKWNYLITFSIITALLIFSSVWFGFYMAKELTYPVKMLAEATQRVGKGDLNFKVDYKSEDEIGLLVACFNEMTLELKSRDEELTKRKEYIEAILKNVAAGILAIDQKGKISMINEAFKGMFKVGEEALGRNYKEIFLKNGLSEIDEFLDFVYWSKNSVSKRYAKFDLGDGQFSVIMNGTRISGKDGKLEGIIVIFNDISQFELIYKASAWREVAKRVAHEIKNPLTPIKLSAQRLKRKCSYQGLDKKTVFECVDTIISQVDQLKELLDQFSRLATMPVEEKVETDINEILDEIFSIYNDAFDYINFRIEKKRVPKVLCERQNIKRALINIVENGIDSISTSGDIVIRSDFDPTSKKVIIAVEDTGCGIPKEDRDKVFEPYFSKKPGGKGIGLSIASSIVYEHKGRIRVEDNFPKGTRFIIELLTKDAGVEKV